MTAVNELNTNGVKWITSTLKDSFKFHCATDVNPNLQRAKNQLELRFSISLLLINSTNYLQIIFLVIIMQMN